MVDDPLTDVDVRVLGALIEKAMTTPEYYPLSLNALANACNQSSNRDPVVQFDEEAVAHSIESLRRRGLVRAVKRSDSRVTKFQHIVHEAMNLDAREAAVLCVLMLRGPQTMGELKTRTARLADFESPADIESVLNGLIERQGNALVRRLPRRHGQKEVRYAHLLSGEVSTDAPEPATVGVRADSERISALEEAVMELTKEVSDLQTRLEAFRKQFL
jgi:uncharacterized protein YceH (UPF0502 family)